MDVWKRPAAACVRKSREVGSWGANYLRFDERELSYTFVSPIIGFFRDCARITSEPEVSTRGIVSTG